MPKKKKSKSKMPKGIMKQEKVKVSPRANNDGTKAPYMSTHRADVVYQKMTKGEK